MDGVKTILLALGRMPVERCAAIGAITGAVLGGIVGLIVGLHVNAATAWFAVFELGIPTGIGGGLVGCIIGLIMMAGRRIKQSSARSV